MHAVSVDAALAVIEGLEAQSEVRPYVRSVSTWASRQSGTLLFAHVCDAWSRLGTHAALVLAS